MTSDLPALLPRSCNAACLSAGDTVNVSGHSKGCPASGPGEVYEHFTLKEIDEQPRAVADAMRGRVSFDTYDVTLEDFTMSDEASPP